MCLLAMIKIHRVRLGRVTDLVSRLRKIGFTSNCAHRAL